MTKKEILLLIWNELHAKFPYDVVHNSSEVKVIIRVPNSIDTYFFSLVKAIRTFEKNLGIINSLRTDQNGNIIIIIR